MPPALLAASPPPPLPPPPFSWAVMLTLLLIVVASGLMFWALAKRWTQRRQWVELSDWAAQNRLKLFAADRATLPAPLHRFTDPPPEPGITLAGARGWVVQMYTPAPATATAIQPPAAASTPAPPMRWNLLVRRLEAPWVSTGLRPVANSASLLDVLPLTSFPTMAPPQRFVIYGTDSPAARRLAKSNLLGLLPPDIGFLLHGPSMILDFSARPFDTIELSRMTALADQLMTQLPMPGEN